MKSRAHVVRWCVSTRFQSKRPRNHIRRYVNYGATSRAAPFICWRAARALARVANHVDFYDIDAPYVLPCCAIASLLISTPNPIGIAADEILSAPNA